MNVYDFLPWLLSRFTDDPLPKPHPDFPALRCKSCDRELTIINHHRVPEKMLCCGRCWSKVPIHERIKLSIMVDDRESGGLMSILASMGESAILEQRNGK